MTSTAEPDYWSLLGLGPEADADQLKRAFRREARRWHPDLNGNDPVAEERFKLVNEAYAVLSDPRRRSAWEQGDPGTGRQDDPFEHGFPDFEDFLEVVLGEPSRRSEVNDPAVHDSGSWSEPPVAAPPPPPPVRAQEDLESIVELTPEQALHGTTVELNLEDGTVVELDTLLRLEMAGGCGWRGSPAEDATTFCSCGCKRTMVCASMVCGSTTGSCCTRRMQHWAVLSRSRRWMERSPCRYRQGPPVDDCCGCAGAAWNWTIAAVISSWRLWWSFQPTLATQNGLCIAACRNSLSRQRTGEAIGERLRLCCGSSVHRDARSRASV